MALTRCEEHGLYYDADRDAGCSKCLDAGAPAAPNPYAYDGGSSSSSGGSSMLKPILIVAILGGIGYGGYRFVQNTAERGEEIFAEAKEEVSRMSPARFQQQIQAIEALVFQPQPDIGDGTRIEQAALGLMRRMVAGGRQQLVQGGVLARPITEFAARARRAGNGEDYPLAQVRADWIQVRDRVFEPAAWFRK